MSTPPASPDSSPSSPRDGAPHREGPAGEPPRRRAARRWGKALTICGAVMTVLGMVLFAVVAGFVGERSPESMNFTTYQSSGTHHSFASQAGIYVADQTQHLACTTTNQDGQHVPTSMTGSDKIVINGQTWYMVGTIEPGKDDLVLNVSCPGVSFAVGDPADVLAGPDLTNVPGLVLGFGVIMLGVLALHVGGHPLDHQPPSQWRADSMSTPARPVPAPKRPFRPLAHALTWLGLAGLVIAVIVGVFALRDINDPHIEVFENHSGPITVAVSEDDEHATAIYIAQDDVDSFLGCSFTTPDDRLILASYVPGDAYANGRVWLPLYELPTDETMSVTVDCDGLDFAVGPAPTSSGVVVRALYGFGAAAVGCVVAAIVMTVGLVLMFRRPKTPQAARPAGR